MRCIRKRLAVGDGVLIDDDLRYNTSIGLDGDEDST
jgi:hypothetical protein